MPKNGNEVKWVSDFVIPSLCSPPDKQEVVIPVKLGRGLKS